MKLITHVNTIGAVLAIALQLGSTGHAKETIPGVEEQPATYFFTGKPYDSDLGNYTFNARNYNPEINRWSSADPSGFPDGANNTLYLGNAMLNAVDPSGLQRATATGTFTITATWKENYLASRAITGFEISLPILGALSISPSAGWDKIGNITYPETGTHWEDAQLPQILIQTGWAWVDGSGRDKLESNAANPTYGPEYDYQVAGLPSGGIYEKRRDATQVSNYSWTRIYEKE